MCSSRQTAGNHGNTAPGASTPARPVWEHATAVVDDVPATMGEEQDVNRAQEPSQPSHVENRKILPKATPDDA